MRPDVIPLGDVDALTYNAATTTGGWHGREGIRHLHSAMREARLAADLNRDKALDDARELLVYYDLALAGPSAK